MLSIRINNVSFLPFQTGNSPASLPSDIMDTKKGLIASDINDTLFSEIASNIGLVLISWRPVAVGDGQSGSGKLLTAGHELDTRIEGHFEFDITGNKLNGASNSNVVVTKQVLLRAKSAGEKLISMFSEFAGKGSKEEGTESARAMAFFQHSHIRDVQLAKAAMHDPILQALMPSIHYAKYDHEHDKSFFVMERFNTAICSHIDCIEGGSSFGQDSWTTEAINHVLAGIATVHARFLDNITALPEAVRSVLLDGINITTSSAAEFMKIETSLLKQRKPALLSDFAKETIDKIADNASYIEHTLHEYPKTLVHNDFNNRNCCLRRHPSKDQTYLCAYDCLKPSLVPALQVLFSKTIFFPLIELLELIE